MSALKDSAKVMVTNVTSLLKTVKTVEDEAARGTSALESTIEALRQEIKVRMRLKCKQLDCQFNFTDLYTIINQCFIVGHVLSGFCMKA